MAGNTPVKDLDSYVDLQLRMQRPDRYEPGADWLDDVANSIPDEMITDEDLLRFKRKLVNDREGQACKKANNLLRKVGEDRQPVLDWWDSANDPIALEIMVADEDGNLRKKKERVALRAATPEDFRAWSHTERERAEKDYRARILACEGADFIAEEIEKGKFLNFQQWAESQSPLAA